MIDFLNAFYQVFCADEFIEAFIYIFLMSDLNLMRIQFLLDPDSAKVSYEFSPVRPSVYSSL